MYVAKILFLFAERDEKKSHIWNRVWSLYI